jgi:TPR repeat protein
MINLGFCYKFGHGIEKNQNKAFELYQRAMELGNSAAFCNLGICY